MSFCVKCLFVFSLLFVSPAFAQGKAKDTNGIAGETCRILGKVIKTEQWLTSPYKQAPSAFSDVYTRLTLEIQNTALHEKYKDRTGGFCKTIELGKAYSFKLCAPTKPEVGDIINGIIAPSVGAAEYGCLFDLTITGNARQQNAPQ